MTHAQSPALTRRSLLAGAATMTGSAVFVGTGSWVPASAKHVPRGQLALVQPLAANKLYYGYGVCAHATFRTTVYGDVDAWMSRIAALGATYFRSRYNPSNSGTTAAIAAARKYGIGWLMEVVGESGFEASTLSTAETLATLRHIAANAADICVGIEGVNEPNHRRDGGVPPADWAVRATEQQRAIWTFAKADLRLANKPIVGPSLHNTAAMQSYTATNPLGGRAHYLQLRDAGIAPFQDVQGLHAYSSGMPPAYRIDDRLGRIYDAFGTNYPVWVTETGYTNAIAQGDGQKPVQEEAAAVYGPQGVLGFGRRGMRVSRYELLDDPDAGAKDEQEANFGLWRVESHDARTWTPKPEVAAVSALLAQLKEPRAQHTPKPVGLKVTSPVDDLVTTVVGKADGSVMAYFHRGLPVWDTDTRQPIVVPSVTVTVQDRASIRKIPVDARVVGVAIRR